MSWPFSMTAKREPGVIAPDGSRIIGLTADTGRPIKAPKGHSLLLAAAGGAKTTAGAMPSLFSLAASEPQKAVLILDSKNGEMAQQTASMLIKLGRKVAIIDDMGVLPESSPSLVSLNALSAAIATHERDPASLIYALDNIGHTLIEEPQNDARNRYWRAWPREDLIEFAIRVLMKRNTKLATLGGVAALLQDSELLLSFAAIEAEDDDPALRSIAVNILGMVGHEHWPQHLEAAQSAVRLFGQGTKLHQAGSEATHSHEELVREGYIIFVVGPQAFINKLGPYYALHLMAFTQALYAGAGPLRIIADEFTNAPLKTLVEALTTLRAFGCEVHMIAQSRSEIIRRFGKLETETIEENAIVKQWFGFSSFEEADRVSKAMGDEQAVTSTLSADSETVRLQTGLQLAKQRWMSPAQLMAMPKSDQLVHVKGIGFFVARKLSQQHIAPFCHLLAPNPLEGGTLPPDPKITLRIDTE